MQVARGTPAVRVNLPDPILRTKESYQRITPRHLITLIG
jgi:hypothetical protein